MHYTLITGQIDHKVDRFEHEQVTVVSPARSQQWCDLMTLAFKKFPEIKMPVVMLGNKVLAYGDKAMAAMAKHMTDNPHVEYIPED